MQNNSIKTGSLINYVSAMLKYIETCKSHLRGLTGFITGRQRVTGSARRSWSRDPLSHPDLERMSQTELADLPFDPRLVCDEPRWVRTARPVRAAQPSRAVTTP